MRAYRVEDVKTPPGQGVRTVIFQGTQSDASAAKREMAEANGVRPLADIKVTEVDIPTDKARLLDYINALIV